MMDEFVVQSVIKDVNLWTRIYPAPGLQNEEIAIYRVSNFKVILSIFHNDIEINCLFWSFESADVNPVVNMY